MDAEAAKGHGWGRRKSPRAPRFHAEGGAGKRGTSVAALACLLGMLVGLLPGAATPVQALEIVAAPAEAGQWWDPTGANETMAVVLLHHPFDFVDPFGVPFPAIGGAAGADGVPGWPDSFSYRYAPLAAQSTEASGAFPFPTYVADGVEPVFSIPDGQQPFQSTLANYTQALQRRLALEAPLGVAVRAQLVGGNIVADLAAWPADPEGLDPGTAQLHLWVAIVEDGIHYEPPPSVANGITDHRFTVRGIADLGPLDAGRLAKGNATQATWVAARGEDWQADRLSVAAWVQAATPGRFAVREVVQAAAAPLGGSSTQVAKAGLVELYSATWCGPCLYGDLAAEQLAIRYGNATELAPRAQAGYIRAAGPYEGPGAGLPSLLGGLGDGIDLHDALDALLLAAAACAVAGAFAAGRAAWDRGSAAGSEGAPRSARRGRDGRWLAAAAALAWLAFAALLGRFLASDLSFETVFLYSSVDLDWQWKLAGAWSSREGSLLLWAAMLALVTWLVARGQARGDDARAHTTAVAVGAPDPATADGPDVADGPLADRPAGAGSAADGPDAAEVVAGALGGDAALRRGHAWTRVLLAAATALFLLACLQDSPFGRTSANLLQGRPLGNGLNPTLKSGFILIHPPLMFLAYAITTVPAAAALGHLLSGTDRWSRIAMQWSRLGWLVMTFAIGLGAMWAYYTLGFGGYFAWDPVEVANLLPWLALTLYLHVQLHHARHGTYVRLGPALAVLPLAFTLFSTISTRSGLWVSVHAFTDPTDSFNPDAAARILRILEVEPSLAFYVGLFFATLAIMLGAWTYRAAQEIGRMRRFALGAAVTLAAAGLAFVVAPTWSTSALLHAGWMLTGSAAYGLLAIGFGAVVLAAVPVLLAPAQPAQPTVAAPAAQASDADLSSGETATTPPATPPAAGPLSAATPPAATISAATPPGTLRDWVGRINLRTLNAYAAAALGLALLVLFLFHMAAVNGWSTAFYEARFPYLAAPVLLGLFVLQTHGPYGRTRSLVAAAGLALLAVLARVAWPASSGAMLAVLAAGATAAGLDRVRRAARPSGIPRRTEAANVLLWLAALLDVLFWAAPPTLRFGFGTYSVSVFTGIMLTVVALAFLWLATLVLAGAPVTRRQQAWMAFAVGALGGFYVAAPLAAAAWWLRRGETADARDAMAAERDARGLRERLKQAGVYGLHLAIALAVVGYAASTYAKQAADAELAPGQSLQVGGYDVRYDASPAVGRAAGTFVDEIAPRFALLDDGRAVGTLHGSMEWETRAGAHYPTPSVLHLVAGDVYLDVEAVHLTGGAACAAGGAQTGWIEAYRVGTPGRACVGDTFDKVRVKVVHLPGVNLLWLAMLLFVLSMALVMLHSDGAARRGAARQGFSAGNGPRAP